MPVCTAWNGQAASAVLRAFISAAKRNLAGDRSGEFQGRNVGLGVVKNRALSGKVGGGDSEAAVEQIERGMTLIERSTGVTRRPESLATSRIIE